MAKPKRKSVKANKRTVNVAIDAELVEPLRRLAERELRGNLTAIVNLTLKARVESARANEAGLRDVDPRA